MIIKRNSVVTNNSTILNRVTDYVKKRIDEDTKGTKRKKMIIKRDTTAGDEAVAQSMKKMTKMSIIFNFMMNHLRKRKENETKRRKRRNSRTSFSSFSVAGAQAVTFDDDGESNNPENDYSYLENENYEIRTIPTYSSSCLSVPLHVVTFKQDEECDNENNYCCYSDDEEEIISRISISSPLHSQQKRSCKEHNDIFRTKTSSSEEVSEVEYLQTPKTFNSIESDNSICLEDNNDDSSSCDTFPLLQLATPINEDWAV